MTKRRHSNYEFMRMLEGLTPWQRITITLRAIWIFTRDAVHHPTRDAAGKLGSVIAGFIDAYGGEILRVLLVGAAVVLWFITITT